VLMLVMGVAPALWLNTIQTGVHPPWRVPLRALINPNLNPGTIPAPAPNSREVQR
jgi:hypothetical protein